MRELSIFVDESGSDGLSDRHYLLTVVMHDQSENIADSIAAYEGAVQLCATRLRSSLIGSNFRLSFALSVPAGHAACRYGIQRSRLRIRSVMEDTNLGPVT